MTNISQAPLAVRVADLISETPGMTDRDLTDALFGRSTHPSQINQTCRQMAAAGHLRRDLRVDGRLGNFPIDGNERGSDSAVDPPPFRRPDHPNAEGFSEDEVKRHLQAWLEAQGWQVVIAWGKFRGVDLLAQKHGASWVIEAKGCGSRQPMRVNYFLAVLGETLQRMNDPKTKYSIALPDMPQFRGLWQRLPGLVKQRTGITALFASPDGRIEESG